MRGISLILALGIIYLSSCGKPSGNSTVTTYDSVSKNGNFQLSFTSVSGASESFYVNDYTLNGIQVIDLYASIIYSNTDSLYHLSLQMLDEKKQQASVIFYGTDTSQTGTYTNTVNNSTLIDYTNGENVTYTIIQGSTVNITQGTYPIQGTFNFNINHNFYNSTATGSFTIFH